MRLFVGVALPPPLYLQNTRRLNRLELRLSLLFLELVQDRRTYKPYFGRSSGGCPTAWRSVLTSSAKSTPPI